MTLPDAALTAGAMIFVAWIANVFAPALGRKAQKKANGELVDKNVALRKIDVVEENQRRMLEDNDRLRERVDLLEAERDADKLEILELRTTLREVEATVADMTTSGHSAENLAKLAVAVLDRVRRAQHSGAA